MSRGLVSHSVAALPAPCSQSGILDHPLGEQASDGAPLPIGPTGFRFKDKTGSRNGVQKAKIKIVFGSRPKVLS